MQQKEFNTWRKKSNQNIKHKKLRSEANISLQVARKVTKEMAKNKSNKSGKENPGVNIAAIKAFIKAGFQDQLSKNTSITSTTAKKNTDLNERGYNTYSHGFDP